MWPIFLAAGVLTGSGHDGEFSAKPRPKRRRRRAKADRGLPDDVELRRLAEAYLIHQRQLWPDLDKRGLLPKVTDESLDEMVEDFKRRHRKGKIDVAGMNKFATLSLKLGGSYTRFSCDNSDPTSIIDQLVNCLNRARKDECLIPWSYVFSDYSISGLDSSRHGYTSYKAILSDDNHVIHTTYVDDFTRASRNELEWWNLATMCKRLGKGLVGASDGFNLADLNSDVFITVFGLVSRLFIKGLKEKVMRGMKGATQRGGCLGKLPLGFTRRVQVDQNGIPVCRADGRPRHVPCIDPQTRDDVILLFRLYLVEKLSPNKIAKRFNELQVDGWAGWTDSVIKKLLANPAFIGVFIWNRTRREFDFENWTWVTVKNPTSEWLYCYDPELAIMPHESWFAAQQQLALSRQQSPLTGRKLSRNQVSATTLFSGTLICQYCGHEIMLNRSAGKYKSMYCPNGPAGLHGCKLSTSKSTNIIEQCLLRFITDALLAEDAINVLVSRANTFLAEESCKPKVNVRPLRSEARRLEAKIAKLVRRIEDEPDEDLCRGYHQRVRELQRTLNSVHEKLREAEAQKAQPPMPLDLGRVKVLLADIRALLNQGIPAAADAIRELTGPIRIHQETVPGRKRARWIATFAPNLVKLLAHCGRRRDYPDSITLEYLSNRKWITPAEQTVSIDRVPRYEDLSADIKAVYEKYKSVEVVAAHLGINQELVRNALHFADAGKRPKLRAKRAGITSTVAQPAVYQAISAEVVKLRDDEEKSFTEIARIHGVHQSTVRRAYDFGHPELVQTAVSTGMELHRGRRGNLKPAQYKRICAMLKGGEQLSVIASAASCTVRTVFRHKRAMNASGELPSN